MSSWSTWSSAWTVPAGTKPGAPGWAPARSPCPCSGAPGQAPVLSFEATPGPSRPESPRRTVVLQAGDRLLGRVEIDRPTRVAIPFVTAGSREVLTLSTPEIPTVTVMPNGDRRPLLVGIRELAVARRSPDR
jgi:hypothetical protein